MLYKSTSIKEVIGRIIRNTRLQDSSYIDDIVEWIPEAMGYMRTRQQMHVTYQDITVEFHKAKMPCGLVALGAVEHSPGYRMMYSNSTRAIEVARFQQTNNAANIPVFMTEVATPNHAPFTGPQNYIWKTTLTAAQSLPFSNHYYTVEMGYINTSMCDGQIRAHFTTTMLDEDGYPLIPDNEDYKEALYYYVRAKMFGAGFKDPAYSEVELMRRYEMYAVRAVGQIRYPSVDQVQAKIEAHTRFVPPPNYWESFFANPGPERLDNII